MADFSSLLSLISLAPKYGVGKLSTPGGMTALAAVLGGKEGRRSMLARYTGAELTGAEREANRFSANQAAIERDWQEKMYNQYESPAAMMRQYQEAGLNPALMYGGAGSPSPSFSGGSPGSVSPSGMLDPISAILDLARSRAEIDNIKADTRNKNAEGAGRETQNQYLAEQIQLGLSKGYVEVESLRAGLDKIFAETDAVRASTARTLRELKLIDERITTEQLNHGLQALDNVLKRKQSDVLDLDILKKEWEAQYREDWGVSPDIPIWNSIPTLTLSMLSRGRDWVKALKELGYINGDIPEADFDEYGNSRH